MFYCWFTYVLVISGSTYFIFTTKWHTKTARSGHWHWVMFEKRSPEGPCSLAVENTEKLWIWWSSVSLLAISGCLSFRQNVQLRVIICRLVTEGAAGMWLNNGKRFWEKESTLSCNGTRQSRSGELESGVSHRLAPFTRTQSYCLLMVC